MHTLSVSLSHTHTHTQFQCVHTSCSVTLGRAFPAEHLHNAETKAVIWQRSTVHKHWITPFTAERSSLPVTLFSQCIYFWVTKSLVIQMVSIHPLSAKPAQTHCFSRTARNATSRLRWFLLCRHCCGSDSIRGLCRFCCSSTAQPLRLTFALPYKKEPNELLIGLLFPGRWEKCVQIVAASVWIIRNADVFLISAVTEQRWARLLLWPQNNVWKELSTLF